MGGVRNFTEMVVGRSHFYKDLSYVPQPNVAKKAASNMEIFKSYLL